jgi:hypothetical protein
MHKIWIIYRLNSLYWHLKIENNMIKFNRDALKKKKKKSIKKSRLDNDGMQF